MSDQPEVRGAHAAGGVAEARRALVAWVDAAGEDGRVFLQARLRAAGGGRYEIRHSHDGHRSIESLEWVSRDPYYAREIAQTTSHGEHRPLKTSPNLKQGWALVDLDAAGMWTALEYLYPAAAVHWHAGRAGSLRVTHWRETAARQGGIYASVRLLEDGAVRNAARACCGDTVCLRRVAWEIDDETPVGTVDAGPVEGDAEVPCPEACSMFVSFARQVGKLERAPRREMHGLAPMGEEELAQLRGIVAAAASGGMPEVREGEFEDPNNLRRIRYLAARMVEAEREGAGAA